MSIKFEIHTTMSNTIHEKCKINESVRNTVSTSSFISRADYFQALGQLGVQQSECSTTGIICFSLQGQTRADPGPEVTHTLLFRAKEKKSLPFFSTCTIVDSVYLQFSGLSNVVNVLDRLK